MDRENLLTALSDNIKIDQAKCTYCGLCVERCILDNLRMKLAPCRQACPLGVNAQGYVSLIARKEEDKARELIRRDLPFPEIIGRICDHPCEKTCHRNKLTGQAVSLRALKRYLFANQPAGQSWFPPLKPATGKRAAVVGSGPAGLMAAFDLAVKGHAVSVFEAGQKPGGLMATAIPPFRLPEEVVLREIGLLERMGVEFHCGVKVGQDLSLDELEADCGAIILAVGQGGSRRLKVEGEQLAGVHYALPLLAALRRGQPPKLSGRVVVIGGGNAAVDAAQTALRLGAQTVSLVSLEAEAELPAFAHEIAQAKAEGIRFHCSWGPTRIRGDQGRVAAVEFKRCLKVYDQGGAFCPAFDASRLAEFRAEFVIIAIGQAGGALEEILPQRQAVHPVSLQTGRDKIFLAGDCHLGPSSVIQAMASGRRAAESVDRLFNNEHLIFNRSYAGPMVTEFEIDTIGASEAERVWPRQRPFAGRGDFAETEEAYTLDEARQEAKRCYSCGGPFGRYRTCWFCLPCEVVCPEEALWVEIPYLLR